MTENKEESLIAHLEALRETILKCLIALCVVIPFALWLAPYVLNFLVDILAGSDKLSFNFFSPMEVFLLQLKTALLLDVIVCFPYMAKKYGILFSLHYTNMKKSLSRRLLLLLLFFLLSGLRFVYL